MLSTLTTAYSGTSRVHADQEIIVIDPDTDSLAMTKSGGHLLHSFEHAALALSQCLRTQVRRCSRQSKGLKTSARCSSTLVPGCYRIRASKVNGR